jgi:hypothetical protein
VCRGSDDALLLGFGNGFFWCAISRSFAVPNFYEDERLFRARRVQHDKIDLASATPIIFVQ